MKKIIIIVLALAVVLGFLFWKFAPNFLGGDKKEEAPKDVTLNISSLWEKEDLVKPALEAYTKDHPNIKINYKYESSTNYRSRIQAQINEPKEEIDIFLIHSNWLPMFLKAGMLAAAPKEVMGIDEYSKSFYPVVKGNLTSGDKIYAIPRGIDGLALYYNEDILTAAGVEVPKTWGEFITAARTLTVKDQQTKEIKTAGAAIGATGNIDHWSDIVGLLFLQNPGADPANPGTPAGAEVIDFYTSFVLDEENAVWDPNWEHSTDAFASNKVAFYFGPSWRASELKVKNPQLKFKTASMPQVPQVPEKNVSWASYWAYAVSAKSPDQKEAWEFLKYFTSSETQKSLYNVAGNDRLFGLPYSRVDLQKDLLSDSLAGAFVSQGPNYKSWYLASNTFDQAINDNIIKYYEDAINATLQGGDSQAALETTGQGVAQVLSDYFTATPAQ